MLTSDETYQTIYESSRETVKDLGPDLDTLSWGSESGEFYAAAPVKWSIQVSPTHYVKKYTHISVWMLYNTVEQVQYLKTARNKVVVSVMRSVLTLDIIVFSLWPIAPARMSCQKESIAIKM